VAVGKCYSRIMVLFCNAYACLHVLVLLCVLLWYNKPELPQKPSLSFGFPCREGMHNLPPTFTRLRNMDPVIQHSRTRSVLLTCSGRLY
jgi:hypothetical protein